MNAGYLCVGGPWDGRWFGAQRGAAYFKVVLQGSLPLLPVSSLPTGTVELETITYVLRALCGQQIWTPETQGADRTMALLCAGYLNERAAPAQESSAA